MTILLATLTVKKRYKIEPIDATTIVVMQKTFLSLQWTRNELCHNVEENAFLLAFTTPRGSWLGDAAASVIRFLVFVRSDCNYQRGERATFALLCLSPISNFRCSYYTICSTHIGRVPMGPDSESEAFKFAKKKKVNKCQT